MIRREENGFVSGVINKKVSCYYCGQTKLDHQLFENEYWCDDNNYLGKTYIE